MGRPYKPGLRLLAQTVVALRSSQVNQDAATIRTFGHPVAPATLGLLLPAGARLFAGCEYIHQLSHRSLQWSVRSLSLFLL